MIKKLNKFRIYIKSIPKKTTRVFGLEILPEKFKYTIDCLKHLTKNKVLLTSLFFMEMYSIVVAIEL